MIIVVRIFFFFLRRFHFSSERPLHCQQWDKVHCLIRQFQRHHSGDSPNAVFVFPLRLQDYSLIGAGCWQEPVSSSYVWSGICASEEVNYTTFKNLLPPTIHPGTNHILDARWSNGAWQLCAVATVALMVACLAGSVCPAVCLFELAGRLVQSPLFHCYSSTAKEGGE